MCRKYQIFGVMEPCIEGITHAMHLLRKKHAQEEDRGLLLVNAMNAYNEDNRMTILWAVRFKGPSGAQLTFNRYRHWSTLMVRDMDGSSQFFNIKEGVT